MDRKKVSELAKQVRGVSYKPEDLHDSLDDNSVISLRANNINDGKINFEDVVYVDKSKVSKEQYLCKGDIFAQTVFARKPPAVFFLCARIAAYVVNGRKFIVRTALPAFYALPAVELAVARAEGMNFNGLADKTADNASEPCAVIFFKKSQWQ